MRQTLASCCFAVVVFIASNSVSSAAVAGASEAPAASLSRTTVDGKGRDETLLTVTRYGRYAIGAESKQGTAVQLINRMVGPGEIRGQAGSKNGRIDAILDRGTYKLVTWSAKNGKGQVKVWAKAFKEKNAPEPPVLVETKTIASTLEDFEQVSYWLPVQQARTLLIEAAGRNLSDMRLWKDGEWLTDAVPSKLTTQPVVGRPLTTARMNVRVEPGLYLLTVYGGQPLAWAEENKTHPLYLRFGIPQLANAGRFHSEVSPFGVDRYRVPQGATFYRIELPEARPATLAIEGLNQPGTSFGGSGWTAAVTKQSLPPVAEVNVSVAEEHVVTVTAAAGQPYVLQFFQARESADLSAVHDPVDYWVSTLQSGFAEDNLDPTSLVVCGKEVRAHSTVTLADRESYHRRFNLLDWGSLWIEVKDGGQYQVDIVGEGVEAKYRFEPLVFSTPAHYQAPADQASGSKWDLQPGFYRLSLIPSKKGIADVAIRKASGLSGLVNQLTGLPLSSAKPPATYGAIHIEPHHDCWLVLNHQPGVTGGAVIRNLPLDLRSPLPLILAGGSTLEVPFSTKESGALVARSDDGQLLPLDVDGHADQASLSPGRHLAKIHVEGKNSLSLSLAQIPEQLMVTSLPPLPDTAKATRPKFDQLSARSASFFDLGREAQKTFFVRVDQAGLYRLESTGLLATRGTLRTRTVTSLNSATQNGVGRNFLIEQYLREGDYQLTVSSEGTSAGHLGVQLVATQFTDGGELSDGVVARASVPAGTGMLYRFKLADTASYHLHAYGIGRTFRARLEDGEGWPIEPPNQLANFNLRLTKGNYRLMLLPEAVDSLQLTQMDRATPAPKHSGHGPHDLVLAQCSKHLWREPAAGKERVADSWRFVLPAAATVNVSLTSGMIATVYSDARKEVGSVAIDRAFSGPLPAGSYLIEAQSGRVDNHVDYQVCVTSNELLSGMSRSLSVPQTVTLSVGQSGLFELSSFGVEDVRATLRDANGVTVAKSDDRPDDWNFHLAENLAAGRYTLQVDAVGKRQARTMVQMRSPAERGEPPLNWANAADKQPGNDVLLIPLTVLPPKADLVVVQATAKENTGVALEQQVGGSWVPCGSDLGRRAHVEVPMQAQNPLRIRLWSIDRRHTAIHLQAIAIATRQESEGELASGTALRAIDGLSPELGVASFKLERAGAFHLYTANQGLRATTMLAHGAQTISGMVITTPGDRLYLVTETPASEVQAKRIILKSGDSAESFEIEPATSVVCDLAKNKGPLVALVNSRSGQPGVKLREQRGQSPSSAQAMAVALRSALSVSLNPATAQAEVWPASLIRDPLDAKLTVVSFAKPEVVKLEMGATLQHVTGHQARAFSLPNGTKSVHLVLDANLVAVLSHDDEILSIHWSNEGRLDETVDSNANRLTLLNLDSAQLFASLEFLPLVRTNDAAQLKVGVPWREQQIANGTSRVVVTTDTGRRTLWTKGATSVSFIGNDGRVESEHTGQAIEVPPEGGVVTLQHNQGWLFAWLERGDGQGSGLSVDNNQTNPRTVAAADRVRLSSAQERFRLDTHTPTVFHLRAPITAVVSVKRGDTPAEVTIADQSLSLDVYANDQKTVVTLNSLSGEPLAGFMDVTQSPVVALGEGVGPEFVLGSGQTRFFSFAVKQPSTIGLGIRNDAEQIESELFDQKNRLLGIGVAQMESLEPGNYLLAVHLLPNAVPAKIRPAVVGLNPPDRGPPEEVRRGYYAANQPVEFSARQVSANETYRFGESHAGDEEQPRGDGDAGMDNNDGAINESDQSGTNGEGTNSVDPEAGGNSNGD